jgi:hypothetical protein
MGQVKKSEISKRAGTTDKSSSSSIKVQGCNNSIFTLHRDFNKGRHPAICRCFKRVKSPVRLLETKIFFH